jgi:hypothetical protein
VFTVFFLLFGLDRGGNVAWSDGLTLGCLCASFALFLLLVVVETRVAKEPLAPARIVASPALLASYLCNFFGMASIITMTFNVPLYLQAVRRFSPTRAGLTLLPGVVAGVTGSLGAGIIMQKTGRFYALTIAEYASLTVGTTLMSLFAGVVGWSYVVLLIGERVLEFVCWSWSLTQGMCAGYMLMSLGNGGGITSTLIALIANAGAADQAIATAGMLSACCQIPGRRPTDALLVSYLFRSLGSVVGVSVGSSLVQDTLRQKLRQRLSHGDVDEVSATPARSHARCNAARLTSWCRGRSSPACASRWRTSTRSRPRRASTCARRTRTRRTSRCGSPSRWARAGS